MDAFHVVDRIAKCLGYFKANAGSPMEQAIDSGQHDSAQTVPVFDYQKVQSGNDWIFYYEDNNAFHYSIGKPDWMPAALAGLILGRNELYGLGLFIGAFERRYPLTQTPMFYEDWILRNKAVFNAMSALDISDADRETSLQHQRKDGLLPDLFLSLPATIINLELQVALSRLTPRLTANVMGDSNGDFPMRNLLVYNNASETSNLTFHQLLQWTLDWLSARGLDVDRERMLVRSPGYLPIVSVVGITAGI